MASVATNEDALIKSIAFCDTLANGIDGIPLNVVPFNGIWLQDLLCGCLDLLSSGSLARTEVWVGRRRYLDIQAHHVIFSRNYHDGAVFTVNGTFHLVKSR